MIEYIDFLRNYQCSAEATIKIRQAFVKPFLIYLKDIGKPSRLFGLSAKMIHDYITITAQPMRRSYNKHLTASIRGFLKFAFIKGYLKKDLQEAVPTIRVWKLDSVPQTISWGDIQKLLIIPDRKTHLGRRNYAILLLLITYGLRIGQITSLKLQDIHWQEGVIIFPSCKYSKAIPCPLNKKVANALLAYIKKDRKITEFQEVFLTVPKPQHPLKSVSFCNSLTKDYIKAGLVPQGTRVMRHAFAQRLVNKNTPFKTISDLLGHKHIQSTFIYAKVNVVKLRELSREWPEVM